MLIAETPKQSVVVFQVWFEEVLKPLVVALIEGQVWTAVAAAESVPA